MYDTLLIIWNRLSSIGSEDFVLGIEIISGDKLGEVVFMEDKQFDVLITERLGDKKIYIDIIGYENGMLEYLIGKLNIRYNIDNINTLLFISCYIYGLNDGDTGRDEECREESRELYYMLWSVISIILFIVPTQEDRKGYRELIGLGENLKLPIDNSVRPGVPKTLGKVKGEREGVRKWFAVLYDMLWHVLYVMVYYYLEYYVPMFVVKLVDIRNDYDDIIVSISNMCVMGRIGDVNTAKFILYIVTCIMD
eukprot:393851_1